MANMAKMVSCNEKHRSAGVYVSAVSASGTLAALGSLDDLFRFLDDDDEGVDEAAEPAAAAASLHDTSMESAGSEAPTAPLSSAPLPLEASLVLASLVLAMAAMAESKPENETSMPLTTYGNSASLLPLGVNHHVGASVMIVVRLTTAGASERAREREREIHDVLLGELFNVIAGCWVVTQVQHACESIETIADGDVDRLAKDAVSLGSVSDHLRVAATDIQHNGIRGSGDDLTHLDV